jgi:histidine ammonia-lyase
MGCIAARMTRDMLPKVWKIAAIQALALAQAADLRGPNVMGRDFRKLHGLVRAVSPRLTIDRPLFEEIAAMAARLQTDAAQRPLLPPRPAAPEERRARR